MELREFVSVFDECYKDVIGKEELEDSVRIVLADAGG